MSKPKKPPLTPSELGDLQRQHARLAQLEAVQMLLFSMDCLGERHVTFQMEMNGIVESVIVKRCTQLELDDFIKTELARMADAPRGAGRAAAAPLT